MAVNIKKPLPGPKSSTKTLADIRKAVAKNGFDQILRTADDLEGETTHIPTGILAVDISTLGGIPEGHASMVIGHYSSGKTLLAFRILAAFQRAYPNKVAVFIDVEATADWQWAAKHGVDLSEERLLVIRPESGEQVSDLVDELLRTNDVSIIIVDSIPAMIPQAEIEKGAEDAIVALQARLVGRMITKATNAFSEARNETPVRKPTLFLLNQWRSKIVMMGDPRSVPGGNALVFFTSLFLSLSNKEDRKQDTAGTGHVIAMSNDISFTVTKCKLGNSLKQGEFTVLRSPMEAKGEGYIDQVDTVFAYGKDYGLVTGAGANYELTVDGDTWKGKFKDLKDRLENDPAAYGWVYTEILNRHRIRYGKSGEGWMGGDANP